MIRPGLILYGGQHVSDLSRHPEQCITISGPNREIVQQLLALSDVEHNLREKAQHYHPSRPLYVLGGIALSQNFKIWLFTLG